VSSLAVKTAFLDWRQSARESRAYELLAQCTLEVVSRSG